MTDVSLPRRPVAASCAGTAATAAISTPARISWLVTLGSSWSTITRAFQA